MTNLDRIMASEILFSDQAKTYANNLRDFTDEEWRRIELHIKQRLVAGGGTLMEAMAAMENEKPFHE